MKRTNLLILVGVFMLSFFNYMSGRDLLILLLMRHNGSYWFTNRTEIEMCGAIDWENTNKMKKLIEKGLNINAQGKNGITFLIYSYLKAKKKSFKFLIENGADPNLFMITEEKTGNRTFSGFHFSAFSLAVEDNEDSYYLEQIVKNVKDLNATIPGNIDEKPIYLIYRAILLSKLTNVILLVEAGANPDPKNDGDTVEAALLADNYEMAYYLLQKGVNPLPSKDSIVNFITNNPYVRLKIGNSGDPETIKMMEMRDKVIDLLEMRGIKIPDYAKKWNWTNN